MKRIITPLIALVFFLADNVNATIRRVGFSGGQLSGTDYPDLQQAHDASQPGDTIYLFPGTWTCNMTSRLVMFGKGYLTEGAGSNAGLQAIPGVVNVSITLTSTAASNSHFEGIGGGQISVSGDFVPETISNIRIKRCKLSSLGLYGPCSNWIIQQCIIDSYIDANYVVKNLNVTNSLINHYISIPVPGSNGIFLNCILNNTTQEGNFGHNSFSFQSCIFLGDIHPRESENNFFQNCLAPGADFLPAGNGNKNSVNISNVFVGYPDPGEMSYDASFQLKTGSPAIGAGYDGVDAGIFGGPNPYKLSGIPAIPVFYKLTAPSTIATGSNYTITFSVQSNN